MQKAIMQQGNLLLVEITINENTITRDNWSM